jgi:RNA polymerase sigma-70 factor (ECF subfamily)
MSSANSPQEPLLTRLRRRDEATLTVTVHEHARPLYRMARSMGFKESEAEDLVQDTFAVFLETLERFEGRSQLRTWLFGILHYKMLERRRAMQQQETFDPIDADFDRLFTAREQWRDSIDDLERQYASGEIRRNLMECLTLLPLQQREVFLLREVEDLKSDEICKTLQISVTHFGVLLHRARHRLRECMKGKGWRSSV